MYNIIAIALPIIAAALILLLVRLLRIRLRVPGLSHVSDDPAYMPKRAGEPTAADQWKQVTARWNRWITGPLAFFVGVLVVASTAWLLAYLGWIAIYVFDRPHALAIPPPWFHSLPSFLLANLIGIVTLVVGVPIVGFTGYALHWIGRHTLWPNPGGEGKQP